MSDSKTTGYVGIFRKADNSLRRMRFVRVADLPLNRVPARKTDKAPRSLKEGTELVWDLDMEGYRSFNFSTLEQELEEIHVRDEELPPVIPSKE